MECVWLAGIHGSLWNGITFDDDIVVVAAGFRGGKWGVQAKSFLNDGVKVGNVGRYKGFRGGDRRK